MLNSRLIPRTHSLRLSTLPLSNSGPPYSRLHPDSMSVSRTAKSPSLVSLDMLHAPLPFHSLLRPHLHPHLTILFHTLPYAPLLIHMLPLAMQVLHMLHIAMLQTSYTVSDYIYKTSHVPHTVVRISTRIASFLTWIVPYPQLGCPSLVPYPQPFSLVLVASVLIPWIPGDSASPKFRQDA